MPYFFHSHYKQNSILFGFKTMISIDIMCHKDRLVIDELPVWPSAGWDHMME